MQLKVRARTAACTKVSRLGIITYDRTTERWVRPKLRRTAHLLRVLEHIYLLMSSNTHATKRDIYYMDTTLFASQAVVNQCLDDLACTLHCTRLLLHIGTTAKGVISGNLTFTENGERVNVADHRAGWSLGNDTPSGFTTSASFVLVVEKDCVLARLIDDGVPQKLNCLILTGRGYPCVATRSFLCALLSETGLRSFVLTDADPFGADIACVYRFGSIALSHENDDLAVPSIEWVGLTLEDCKVLSLPDSVLLDCTPVDIAKATQLLAHPALKHNSGVPGVNVWRTRIASFLETKKKAEIQALCSKGLSFIGDDYLVNVCR